MPVRSRRTAVHGSGPVSDTLAHLLEAETWDPDDAVARASIDVLVVVLDGGDFDPVRTNRPRDVGSGLHDLTTVARAPGAHVVVVTSAAVLGARPGQGPLGDDAPVLADAEGSVGELVEAERVLREVVPAERLAVLRTAALVGPGVDTMMTRHFEAPRLLMVRGQERPWQFLHVEDLAEAVRTIADLALCGDLTAGAEGELAATEVARLSGLRTVELPAATAFGVAERLHRLGVLPAPASDLAYAVYPWTVTSARLRQARWQPVYDNEACLAVLLEGARGRLGVAGRRVGGRDAAALGAVGATVALLGTAALVRRARR